MFFVLSLNSVELNDGSLSIWMLNSVTPPGRDHERTGVELLAIPTVRDPGAPTAADAGEEKTPIVVVPRTARAAAVATRERRRLDVVVVCDIPERSPRWCDSDGVTLDLPWTGASPNGHRLVIND